MAGVATMEYEVLVVEDDVEINELLGEYLGLEGMGYVPAFDAHAALGRIAERLFDAIILNVMLPDIDGYELCRDVTLRRATASMPVLMLTCLNHDCDREKGLLAGAYGYMSKPFLPDNLIARVRQAFAWKRRVLTRPPLGQIELCEPNAEAAIRGVNEMVVDIFHHGALADAAVAGIREGFQLLLERASVSARERKRKPSLRIDFRMVEGPAAQIATARPADKIEWTLSEAEPGWLADTILAARNEARPLMVARAGALEAAPEGTSLAAWYQFFGKCGLARYEGDAKLGRVRFERSLRAEPTGESPIVTLGGTGGSAPGLPAIPWECGHQ